MLRITSNIAIEDHEIEINAIRAQGPGGQNVNKVCSAVHLRFDIRASSLPTFLKTRLLDKRDQRISSEGLIVIKAQVFRNQEKNKHDALGRLSELIRSCAVERKARKKTRPGVAAKKKRLQDKKHRGRLKSSRANVNQE